MPLDLPGLTQDIINANKAAQQAGSTANAEQVWATQMALAIQKFVKSGEVTGTTNGSTITGQVT